MRRRGIVSAQLTWLFILIAGAIILAFFFNLSMKHKVVAEEKLSITLRSRVNALFTSAQQTSNTFFRMKLPGAKITYDCSGYRIGSSSSMNLEPAFSPSLIKSIQDTFIIYSMAWSIPFDTTNFLFITSPGVKYVFIHPPSHTSEIYEKLYKDLPPNITRIETEMSKINDVNDTNNYKVRVVSFEDINGKTMQKVKSEITGIYIHPDSSATALNGFAGEVKFYNYTTSGFNEIEDADYNFTGEAMLLAAIFADRPTSFECGMRAAMKRMLLVLNLTIERGEEMKSSLEDPCKTDMDTAVLNLRILNNEAKGYTDFPKGVDRTRLMGKITNVESSNKVLEIYSCPLIY